MAKTMRRYRKQQKQHRRLFGVNSPVGYYEKLARYMNAYGGGYTQLEFQQMHDTTIRGQIKLFGAYAISGVISGERFKRIQNEET